MIVDAVDDVAESSKVLHRGQVLWASRCPLHANEVLQIRNGEPDRAVAISLYLAVVAPEVEERIVESRRLDVIDVGADQP